MSEIYKVSKQYHVPVHDLEEIATCVKRFYDSPFLYEPMGIFFKQPETGSDDDIVAAYQGGTITTHEIKKNIFQSYKFQIMTKPKMSSPEQTAVLSGIKLSAEGIPESAREKYKKFTCLDGWLLIYRAFDKDAENNATYILSYLNPKNY